MVKGVKHAQVKYLERLGVPSQSICNMASIAPRIVGRDPETQLGPVVEYIKKKGLSGLIPFHPPSSDSKFFQFRPSKYAPWPFHPPWFEPVDPQNPRIRGL
jgi:hypothetical protein